MNHIPTVTNKATKIFNQTSFLTNRYVIIPPIRESGTENIRAALTRAPISPDNNINSTVIGNSKGFYNGT